MRSLLLCEKVSEKRYFVQIFFELLLFLLVCESRCDVPVFLLLSYYHVLRDITQLSFFAVSLGDSLGFIAH